MVLCPFWRTHYVSELFTIIFHPIFFVFSKKFIMVTSSTIFVYLIVFIYFFLLYKYLYSFLWWYEEHILVMYFYNWVFNILNWLYKIKINFHYYKIFFRLDKLLSFPIVEVLNICLYSVTHLFQNWCASNVIWLYIGLPSNMIIPFWVKKKVSILLIMRIWTIKYLSLINYYAILNQI